MKLRRLISLILVSILILNSTIKAVDTNEFETESAITKSDLAYFNANFYNYDARKFNFATRALQLYNSEIADSVDDAATLLENVDNSADAGTYATTSTKNTLLFNFSAIDEHYNSYYDEWLESGINATTRTWFNFNKPNLHQNAWTNQAITQGIVGEKGAELDNGLPNFTYTQAGLFIPKEDTKNRTLVEFNGETEEWLTDERLNLKFPFKKTDDGYYEFDSETMYIDNVLSKDSTNNEIQLFEDDYAPQVGTKERGFWPFATGHDFEEYLDGGQSTDNTLDGASEDFLSDQYHFGMNLEAKFVVPENLKVDEEDMIFEFTGDDDLWIYIDGKLALDVGGCHKALGGQINFTSGDITYFDPSDEGDEEEYNKAVLVVPTTSEENWNIGDSGYELFYEDSALKDENGKALNESPTISITEDASWNLYTTVGLDKDNFFTGSVHSIEIFYLERGTGQSNCKMRFNMSTISNIEAQKNAYVYDSKTDTREVNSKDSFAYTGQDVYFELGVKNNSGQILNNVVMYDKELNILFNEIGIVPNVDIEESGIYEELNDISFSKSEYSHIWEDSEITKNFDTLAINGRIKISENGVEIGSILPESDFTIYGKDSDKEAIKNALKRKTIKDIRVEDSEQNTVYVIGRCDEVAFGKPYVEDEDIVTYEIKDTSLYVKQIVVDEDGEKVENPKDAMIDTVSKKDNRSLLFCSNEEKYKKYTSYYNNVEYTVIPVIPNDYELIAIDVRDNLRTDTSFNPEKPSTYNEVNKFIYEGEEYEKYVTVYLKKKLNDNWHNEDAIINNFNAISVTTNKARRSK